MDSYRNDGSYGDGKEHREVLWHRAIKKMNQPPSIRKERGNARK